MADGLTYTPEQVRTLQERITALENAAENMLDVFNRTGEERKAAVDAMVAALMVDFKTAILSSPDLTAEQAEEWLGAGEQQP